MRALIAIPFISGPDHSKLAIESVINQQYHDLLLIDNGADQQTKAVLNHYNSRENVHIISNQTNVYVNPAWNQAMQFFLERNQYDALVLMNSDLILSDQWHVSLERFFNNPDNKRRIPVPVITDHPQNHDQSDQTFKVVYTSIPGVFIVLTREAVKTVYPVPEKIKVWFGDNWIYDLARGSGFETGILSGLVCYHFHGGSRSIQRTADVHQIIEEDKIAWQETVEPMLREKLKCKP